MTKENEKKEPVEIVEKTEWQKRHEEFVARRAAQQAAKEIQTSEEERDESDSEKNQGELEDSKATEVDSQDTTDETHDDLLKTDENGNKNDEEAIEETQDSTSDKDKEPQTPPEKEDKGVSKELEVQDKAAKKAEKREKRLQSRPLRIARAKVASIIFVASLTMLCSAFILSPFSKEKHFKISGLVNADEDAILVSTGIKKSDYLTQVYLNRTAYEKAILDANPWVKEAKISYRFPNHFDIAVTENRIIAYAQTGSGYQPVLETGMRMPVVSEANLPENFLTVNLTDEKAVQSLVTQLAKLDEQLVSSIQVVNPVENAATKDLISLEVKEGHQIRVPLSQLGTKLPLYSKIANSLFEQSIVDMEVGIYTTTAAIEAVMAQEKAEREEAKKKAEEEAKKQAEEAKKNKNEETTEAPSESSDNSQTTSDNSEMVEPENSEEPSTESSGE